MSSAPLALPLVRRSPEELGIPAAALLALADRLAEEGLDPHALLVARHGAVAFEAAWAPYRLDRPALVYSASKTFTSLAIGFLADEGRLSLDAAAADLLAVLAPLGAPVITVRHAPKAATVPLVIEAPAAEKPGRTPPRPQKLPRDCEPAASPLSAVGASDVEARCFVDLGAGKFAELQ